jgi:methylase of polypeptide subunit release factors
VTAAQQWADELAAWAIDPQILAAAPESPHELPPEVFAPGQDTTPSPLAELARSALRPGGSVLDVGAGAGATSFDVVPPDGQLHAVDSQPSMLRALEAAARDRGVGVTTYSGTWPDLAEQVPECDVAVCAHVLYNVPDLAPFAAALTNKARDLVVVELTGTHPKTRLAPMWEAVHRQPLPAGPTAELAVAVLREAGLEPEVHERVYQPPVRTGALLEAWIDLNRQQLCLPPERRDEVVELMQRHPPQPRRSVVLSWPGSAPPRRP